MGTYLRLVHDGLFDTKISNDTTKNNFSSWEQSIYGGLLLQIDESLLSCWSKNYHRKNLPFENKNALVFYMIIYRL